jgi:streptogrisin C
MQRTIARRVAAAALTVGAVAALVQPPAAASAAVALPAQLLDALDRDRGIAPDQARTRLAAEQAASRAERDLRRDLGAAFGGAWLDGADQRLVVAVTDRRAADQVRAAGAKPTVVARSMAQLEAAKSALDAYARSAPGSVTRWYVDVYTNSVVVVAHPGAPDAARMFIANSGADTTAVRILTSPGTPVPQHDLRGGEYYGTRGPSGLTVHCTVGFPVVGGFVTAGHCGGVGATAVGHNGVGQGTIRGSTFPGSDHAWVETNSSWSPGPWVNNHNGSTILVTGSEEAAIGATVCRSGAVTGWRCGTVEAKNATLNYIGGLVVTGLTQTNACSELGDSGGPWLAGQQAQGVHSGGTVGVTYRPGTCSEGARVSLFQPLQPILQAYGLRLLTAS